MNASPLSKRHRWQVAAGVIDVPSAVCPPSSTSVVSESRMNSSQSGTRRNAALRWSTDPSPFSRASAASEPALSREQRIAVAAYRLAEQRGFAPGRELEDWLAAEREVDGEARDGTGVAR
jgi:DUF2934 family protein